MQGRWWRRGLPAGSSAAGTGAVVALELAVEEVDRGSGGASDVAE